MDRKGIIAVATAVLILVIWQFEFAPKFMPPTPPPGAAATSPSPAASAVPEAAVPANGPVIGAATAPLAVPEEPKAAEQITSVAGPSATYRFTNLGGGISNAELTDYPAESGSNVDLNEFGSMPIGALSGEPAVAEDLPY